MKLKSEPRELIFGLIAPIGVDGTIVQNALQDELAKVRYSTELVKISESLEDFHGKELDRNKFFERKNELMDAGNELRRWHRAGDAAALLAMLAFGKSRKARLSAKNILVQHAYIVDSLKHPDEVETLRAIYGPAFISIALYDAPENRRKRIVNSATSLFTQFDDSDVSELMLRDENEDIPYGQKVRAAFELADFVLDLSPLNVRTVPDQIARLIRCLFGDAQITPTLQEYGMSIAHVAKAKSGSLARQVGAAVLRSDGSVAAVGTNEVARPGGGQYTEADDAKYPRGRDVNRGQDSSDLFRQRAMKDLIERLVSAGELAPHDKDVDGTQLFLKWWKSEGEPYLRKSLNNSTIDYVRAVHAEMAAITDAARNGISLREATLYTTTFPCHDCAKHIVACGIKEVVYLAPYPKSLVVDLYDDSIQVDVATPFTDRVHFRSFVGVTPRRYAPFFLETRDRKDREGYAIRFNAAKAKLTLPSDTPEPKAVVVAETSLADQFGKKLDRYQKTRKSTRQTGAASGQI